MNIKLPGSHSGQCKSTGGCYNELVVTFYSTGGGVKGKKNLYLLTLLFICKLKGNMTFLSLKIYCISLSEDRFCL